MTPSSALALIAVLAAAAVMLGWLLTRREGRVLALKPSAAIDPREFGGDRLGSAATVVQFSTVYCTRCPAVRRTISALVGDRPGVEFLHVDVTGQPELASKYRLAQTPTVLVLDGNGVARSRLSGTIDRAALSTELDATIGGVQ